MLISTLVSWGWLGFDVTAPFVGGALTVLASMYLYSS